MYCSECGGAIEDDSKFCRHCGKPQSAPPSKPAPVVTPGNQASAPPPADSGLPLWGIIGFGVIFVVILVAIFSQVPTSPPAQPDAASNTNLEQLAENVTADAAGNTAVAAALPEANWTYRTDTDKVRGGTTYFASTTSTNTAHQNPPYDAETTMTVTVRRSPGSGLNIVVQISSGQLMCPSYEGCTGTVRFDDGPSERIHFSGSADDDSQTIFVNNEKSFLAKLKRSKHLIIEKTLYEAGDPQFEFDVHGLKWDH